MTIIDDGGVFAVIFVSSDGSADSLKFVEPSRRLMTMASEPICASISEDLPVDRGPNRKNDFFPNSFGRFNILGKFLIALPAPIIGYN